MGKASPWVAGSLCPVDNGLVLFPPPPSSLPFPSQVCPLIRLFASTLGAEFIQNVISKSPPGEVEALPTQPSQGGHAALCLPHRLVWAGDPGEEGPNILSKLGECSSGGGGGSLQNGRGSVGL